MNCALTVVYYKCPFFHFQFVTFCDWETTNHSSRINATIRSKLGWIQASSRTCKYSILKFVDYWNIFCLKAILTLYVVIKIRYLFILWNVFQLQLPEQYRFLNQTPQKRRHKHKKSKKDIGKDGGMQEIPGELSCWNAKNGNPIEFNQQIIFFDFLKFCSAQNLDYLSQEIILIYSWSILKILVIIPLTFLVIEFK